MAATYGWLNLISSFGFSHFWRAACVRELSADEPVECADLMCGGAEAALLLSRLLPAGSNIQAYDFCPEMCQLAAESIARRQAKITVELRDVFTIPPTSSFDRLSCTFGIKTLSNSQQKGFAKCLHDWLRPGGIAALVEIHIPRHRMLRWPYLFYLRRIIPLLGKIAQRNASCYRWLAHYVEDFAQRDCFSHHLRETGLRCREQSLFFGCARLYIASKPK